MCKYPWNIFTSFVDYLVSYMYSMVLDSSLFKHKWKAIHWKYKKFPKKINFFLNGKKADKEFYFKSFKNIAIILVNS